MKKIFGLIMTFVLLAGAALPAAAQTSRRGTYASRAAQQRAYERQRREYYEDRYDDRSVWEKHRDKLTVAGGTAAGAAVGAAAGGKKGAIIGALVGAGASALYTYKLRDKDDDDRWRR
ncbi:MAG TPA: glycine zipper domain-containing protein [Pyrinomonadaceae bacterium]|nr:glycine zipper domain-containing protein [Pyrinomonadaceae bacterium]